jgi:SAM-dependent methyltransferase
MMIKKWLPVSVREAIVRWRTNIQSPKGVFEDVYARNQWGGKSGEIYSGPGSRGEMARQYVNTVCNFIVEHEVKSIVDIGCGDFYVGNQLLARAPWPLSYVGLDCAKNVIDANRARFISEGVVFRWTDVISDDLPAADLCLIRQVLQHLSNRQIAVILRKLTCFEWVVITEHYPHQDRFREFNANIAQGAGTRISNGSAVYLDRSPFNLKPTALIGEVDVDTRDPLKGKLRTWLVDMDKSVRALVDELQNLSRPEDRQRVVGASPMR